MHEEKEIGHLLIRVFLVDMLSYNNEVNIMKSSVSHQTGRVNQYLQYPHLVLTVLSLPLCVCVCVCVFVCLCVCVNMNGINFKRRLF